MHTGKKQQNEMNSAFFSQAIFLLFPYFDFVLILEALPRDAW